MYKSSVDISVLVLCFNASNYISQCLSSILTQKTKYSIQVVVMDDCSTDDSIHVIKAFRTQFIEQNIRFKVIQQPVNKGCYGNLVDGLLACRGRIVAYLEGDDFWLDDNKLEFQYNFLTKQNTYIGIGTGCQFVDKNGNLTNQLYYKEATNRSFTYSDAWSYPKFQTSSFAFLNDYPITYDARFNFSQCNDKILIEHLTKYKPIRYDARKSTAYRMHDSNITSKRSKTSIFLHHIRVNWALLGKTGIQNINHFTYAFLKLSYMWINDVVRAK